MTNKEDISRFKEVALDVIKKNPGLTRSEWFNKTCSSDERTSAWHTTNAKSTLWHVFQSQVTSPLVSSGKVVVEGTQYFYL